MAAGRANCISTAATDNNNASWFGMSSAELVMEVSHPVSNILVSRAVSGLLFIFSDKEKNSKCLFYQTGFLMSFQSVQTEDCAASRTVLIEM